MGDAPRKSSAPETDGEDPLFRRFLQREAEALAGVEETIRRAVRFRGWDIPAADRKDIVQEALLQIWREVSRDGFSFSRNFTGFICVVAYRRCLDWRRGRRLAHEPERIGAPDSTSESRPDLDALRRERCDLASRVLAAMPDSLREVLTLHVIEGKGYREIAAELGRSEGAIRTQVWQGLKDARRALEKLQRPAAGRGGESS